MSYLKQLRTSVHDQCGCGGGGPEDDWACDVCRLWHSVREEAEEADAVIWNKRAQVDDLTTQLGISEVRLTEAQQLNDEQLTAWEPVVDCATAIEKVVQTHGNKSPALTGYINVLCRHVRALQSHGSEVPGASANTRHSGSENGARMHTSPAAEPEPASALPYLGGVLELIRQRDEALARADAAEVEVVELESRYQHAHAELKDAWEAAGRGAIWSREDSLADVVARLRAVTCVMAESVPVACRSCEHHAGGHCLEPAMMARHSGVPQHIPGIRDLEECPWCPLPHPEPQPSPSAEVPECVERLRRALAKAKRWPVP